MRGTSFDRGLFLYFEKVGGREEACRGNFFALQLPRILGDTLDSLHETSDKD